MVSEQGYSRIFKLPRANLCVLHVHISASISVLQQDISIMFSKDSSIELSPKNFKNKTINIKLDETNYLQWKQNISFTIASHRLEGFMDGSSQVDDMIVNAN